MIQWLNRSQTFWNFAAGAMLGAVGGAIGSAGWSALIVGALVVVILAANDCVVDRGRT